jgi:hypothetical protein
LSFQVSGIPVKLIERQWQETLFMGTLKTIILILIFLGGHVNFTYGNICPFESDLFSPIIDGTPIKSFDIGIEVIENGDTPFATITTIDEHKNRLLSNFSNSGQLLITQNSFIVNVVKGKISLDFFAYDSTLVTLAAGAGNGYEFEPKSFTITSFVTNNNRVSVFFDGVQFVVPPGDRTQIVEIDIMPVKKSHHLNPSAQGEIPVVIFGSTYLDVNSIEISSLNFGSLAVSTKGGAYYLASVDRINDDEYPDLVVIFEANDTFWSKDFSYATLNGHLSDGTIINGKDNISRAP